MRERAWRKGKRRGGGRREEGGEKKKEGKAVDDGDTSSKLFYLFNVCSLPEGGTVLSSTSLLHTSFNMFFHSLSAPSDPLFIVPVLRSYVKTPLFNLTSLIPFSFFLLPPSPSSPSSSSPCSSFFFSPPFSHNRLRKGTQPSGKRSATRRGISFFSFDSWWYLCRRLKEKRSHARNNGVSMTNIIIVGNYYRVNLFDGTVRSFRYPDDSFFLPLLF